MFQATAVSVADPIGEQSAILIREKFQVTPVVGHLTASATMIGRSTHFPLVNNVTLAGSNHKPAPHKLGVKKCFLLIRIGQLA